MKINQYIRSLLAVICAYFGTICLLLASFESNTIPHILIKIAFVIYIISLFYYDKLDTRYK